MKKYLMFIASSLLVMCSSLSLNGQNANSSYYDAFIKVNSSVMDYKLEAAGVVITAKYDGFYTARIKPSVTPQSLLSIEGVLYVSRALKLETCSDSARYYSRVADVAEGINFDMPYTGKDVIIGVIDCGFDFNHVNFWDANGNTRVKAVYMPFDTTGTQPVVKNRRMPGSAYETPSQIAALTTDDPLTTHGTQTTGIAAGSYKGNAWYGMAPEADIVACGIPEDKLNDVRVANCISYIVDYANRKGKPCVINISLGSNVGAHNGTSFLSQVCQQLSGPGKVIVVSAGNDGNNPVCVHRSLTNSPDTIVTLMSGYGGGLQYSGYVNAWSKEQKSFNTRMIVVNNKTGQILYRSRAFGATSSGVNADISSETDANLAQYFTGTVNIKGSIEYNGDPSSLCELNMRSKSRDYSLGFQYFSPSAIMLAIWTSQYAYFNNYGFSWAEAGSPLGSINDLATTDSVISVGSYNSKQYVTLRDGSQYFRSLSTPLELSYYSSYGPDENGIARPDVCAPGSVIVSSANRYDVTAPNIAYWQPSAFVNNVEYPYCPDLGTSMSAPVVAGAIALWLQANPNLSAGDVRNVLKHSSYKDAHTRTQPSRWGSGKLDVKAGMRYILHMDQTSCDVNGDGEINILDINILINIILGSGGSSDYLRPDVNGDGEVNIVDVNMIINAILGM